MLNTCPISFQGTYTFMHVGKLTALEGDNVCILQNTSRRSKNALCLLTHAFHGC